MRKKNNINFRLITGGCFTEHPYKNYFNYEIYKNVNNAKKAHKDGFFVGNASRDLTKEINLGIIQPINYCPKNIIPLIAAYKGPSDMRTHDFTFQMLPQSVQESKVCTKIASAFKMAMLPSHAGGDSPNAPSMLFGYPDEFEIEFTVNGDPMPKNHLNPMFSIGRSVLTACDLDFATESTALFFEDTQYPVSISMKLTFMEVEVMYREKVIKQGY